MSGAGGEADQAADGARPDERAAIDGSGTARATCVLAPNPSPMTLTGTNTWLVAEPGSGTAAVIDPGPDDERHRRRITAAAHAAGQRITAIILTHGHPDHSDGAAALSRLAGAPVLAADPAFRRAGTSGGAPSGRLAPGDVIDAGGCELAVLATPGHTADSVSLLLAADAALFTGDTVLGRGTTVIAPGGSLADYLDSLDRLRELAGEPGEPGALAALLPGHGPLLAQPAAALAYYRAHREERLDQIRAAVAAGDRNPAQIVARVYAGTDQALWLSAEMSVRAQLDYLRGREPLPPGLSW